MEEAEIIKTVRQLMLWWYHEHGRKFPWRNKKTSKYKLIVTEVLLQRTKAETVANYYSVFFSIYPSWQALANSSEEELSKILKPLGLWRRRAQSLYYLSISASEMNGRFPSDRDSLESLPNVGQYIANAILLFCHDQPQPLLDVNMARVLERIFGQRIKADIRYDPYLQKLSFNFVNCPECKVLNWAILDYATMVCKVNNPNCQKCIIRSQCKNYQKLDISMNKQG